MGRIGRKQSKFEMLRQAVESFVIADATCSRDDAYAAYKIMLMVANLEAYLPEAYAKTTKP